MYIDGAELILKTNNLVKNFGNNHGVFDVDLDVRRGEIVGFVGPNGAGKSTTINLCTGLIKPDSGSIEVFDQPVNYGNLYKLMNKIGVMYSEPTIEEGLTARQIFNGSQELLGKDYTKNWVQMSKILELDMDLKIKQLSLGNKKKVGVINALLHSPELIIMDEPTSGLDPIIRERFMDLLEDAAKNGSAILLSSHDLGEVQQVCDRIMMIKDGKIIIADETKNILNQAQRLFRLIDPPKNLVNKIKEMVKIVDSKSTGKEVLFHTTEFEAVTKLLLQNDFYDFYIERPTLESAFKDYYR